MGACKSRSSKSSQAAPRELSDIVVAAASEFVLAAASLAPTDHRAVQLALGRFSKAYNAFVAPRSLLDDATAYLYARCMLNSHRAGARFVDAPPDKLQDGVWKPFSLTAV